MKTEAKRMSYKQYKTEYPNCTTESGSYNADDKTIVVNVEIPEQSDKEAEAILLQIMDVYESLKDQYGDEANSIFKKRTFKTRRQQRSDMAHYFGFSIKNGGEMVALVTAESMPYSCYSYPRKYRAGKKGYEALVYDSPVDTPFDKPRRVYLGEYVDQLKELLESLKITEVER